MKLQPCVSGVVHLYASGRGPDMILRGHDTFVLSAAISPDGKHLISGDLDGRLKVWNSVTGEELRSWRGHEGAERSDVDNF